MNYKLIDNVVIEDIDHKDAPDYVDAFISSADYKGVPMTDEQIDSLSDDFVYEQVLKSIY
jgi:hypothetical protein